MKNKKAYIKKALILLTLLALGYACLVDDRFYDKSFMNSVASLEYSHDLVRTLASSAVKVENRVKLYALDLELNALNQAKINGKWHIFNITEQEGTKIVKKPVSIVTSFSLIGRGLVSVNNEAGQEYFVSYLSDTKIALFKELRKNKYEVLEAQKVQSSVQEEKILEKQVEEAVEQVMNNDEVLELPLNINLSRLNGQGYNGSMRIVGKTIEQFSVYQNGELVVNFDETVEILQGGVFITTVSTKDNVEKVSGALIGSGEKSYTVRFGIGSLIGMNLVFSQDTGEIIEESYPEDVVAFESDILIEQVQYGSEEFYEMDLDQEELGQRRLELMQKIDEERELEFGKQAFVTEEEKAFEVQVSGFAFTN